MKRLLLIILIALGIGGITIAAIPMRDGTGAEGQFSIAVPYTDSISNLIGDAIEPASDSFKIFIFGPQGYAYSDKMLVSDARILDTVINNVAIIYYFDDWQDIDSTLGVGNYSFIASIYDNTYGLWNSQVGHVYRSLHGQSEAYNIIDWLTAFPGSRSHTSYNPNVDSVFILGTVATDTIGVLLYHHFGGSPGQAPDSVIGVSWP